MIARRAPGPRALPRAVRRRLPNPLAAVRYEARRLNEPWSVPARCIVVGAPARVIKRWDEGRQQWPPADAPAMEG